MEVKQLNELVLELAVLKSSKQALALQTKSVNEEIKLIEENISTVFVENGLDSFKSKEGTAYHSVLLNASIKDRPVFHAWLKDNNYYEDLVSVNSQTLKAFIKELKENTPELTIPGVELSDYLRLGFRKN